MSKSDLRIWQQFAGTLSDSEKSMRVRFKTRVREDGELEVDIRAFQFTKANMFVRERWHASSVDVFDFQLRGIAKDGLTFESDSMFFNSLGQRFCKGKWWSKPRGKCSQALFTRPLEENNNTPIIKLHIKGFECSRPLYYECSFGKLTVSGETKLEDANRIAGHITLEAHQPQADLEAWRHEAEKLIEHLRRILSLAGSTMLRAPVLERLAGSSLQIEITSQTRQSTPELRVFHKLNLQPVLESAVASFLDPPIQVKNLFFAIEWLAMDTTYNELRLVNAMTALENLVSSNITEEEEFILSKRDFKEYRRFLKKSLEEYVDHGHINTKPTIVEEINEKLADLNRRSLRRKLQLLASRWDVPLDGISDGQVSKAIMARNLVVHTGHHPTKKDFPGLWEHVTIIREIVVRFLLRAIGYRGEYISFVAGYHLASFPPVDATAAAKEC